MFSKRNLVDVKKSTSKIQDTKKDLTTRTKHLKIILDNVDSAEAKGLFEANFSHVYNILYDSFIQTELNLRQRVHKAHKEELEVTLWILEQILSLLPELLHKRWQLHSLGRILSKLLHPGNSLKLRRQAIRYFLMWYQALNDNAPEYVHTMFGALVPGFSNQTTMPTLQTGGSIFHDTSVQHPVTATELLPILPPSGNEKYPDHPSKFFLDILLEHMVHTTVRLEWHDKSANHHKCFNFLLERFKLFYLMKICPNFCPETSLYQPNLDLPSLRKAESENEFVHCRVSLIMWVANYVHQNKKSSTDVAPSAASLHEDQESHESSHPSLDSTISLQTPKTATDEDLAFQIVRKVFFGSRDNVNFLHEVYRQAFLMNFGHVNAIRKVITVYKDFIQFHVAEIPPYMLEPLDDSRGTGDDAESDVGRPPPRLRNDSYLGAIHKENLLVRAGMQNVLQLFMTHAANVFLLEANPHVPKMLEEQTDACKRVLNIYRYMVMNTRMDSSTWEQLLLALLQITSLVLGENPPPRKKMQTLGGKLAPAIFQTLIVTWIKANLNVMISRELWDRFLHVLTSLTSWEELIKEWAKTMETLTRVLARHVYNLDLTDLPLDRLQDQKSKRGRRGLGSSERSGGISYIGKTESGGGGGISSDGRDHHGNNNYNRHHQMSVSRQDSTLPVSKKRRGSTYGGLLSLSRSYSETSLAVKRRNLQRNRNPKHRRSVSLDNLPQGDTESIDRTRSPSPAPSSGLESNSIKDSPIQLDVLTSDNSNSVEQQQNDDVVGEHNNRGVICGGSVRGWLPDVAVILWRRMLGALGDVNLIADPKLHSQVFEYLVKLNDTLIRIQQNQGVSGDNQSTPQSPELIPPLTLILPWCFGALMLNDSYEAGKSNALRLLCTVTLNCDVQHRTYLPQFYRFLHVGLAGTNSKSFSNTILKYLGPRFLSLQLPGSSLLLLDLVHACNTILNLTDNLETAPRTEAISIVANLLSLPDNLGSVFVLQPEGNIEIVTCPDIKEHVVSILLKAGRREPKGKARCIALSALGMFIYKELTNRSYHPKVADAINVLLLALKFNSKIIAQLASNILFLLCDHASQLWSQYPRMGNAIIRTLCSALFLHAPLGSTAGESDKALGTALLLCLGEWCMKLEPKRLLEISEYGEFRGTCLLLQVFTVLHKIAIGKAAAENPGGLTQPSLNEDFDPNILSDDLEEKSSSSSSPTTKNQQCQRAITLCAKTVLAHLVTHLGHFPMAIGAARLSSLVVEHDDVPNLTSDELSASIFTAPNIQLFMLSQNVIASLIELPILDLPGGGVTAGLSTTDKQVRVLLRDLSGKSCWDASILYRTPADDDDDEIAGHNDRNNCDLEFEAETQRTASFAVNMNNYYNNNNSVQLDSFVVGGGTTVNQLVPQRAMRHRPPNVLPTVANSAPDLDQLDDLLQYLGHTSRECLESFDRKLNEPTSSPSSVEIEQEALGSVINQKNLEAEESRTGHQRTEAMSGRPVSRPGSRSDRSHVSSADSINQLAPSAGIEQNSFQQCRLLFSQMGLSAWERRRQLHLLNKTERLLRELRNLDNQRCRETHKVAVIYVAPGQEDKNSILSNQGGSAAYEQFLAALAWEVELEGHTGFLGGLQRQGSNGSTAPYVATSFSEAIFHVATRMPGDTAENILNKTRHLGNDEVHIVWSEHCRDYRRDIIPTEFCDILITVYPLGNNLNRVTVNCKPEVPHFGIIFHEVIVESSILAGLVRTTAICASRAKRTTLPFYQQYYEERAISLDTVVTKHKNSTTFEDFISKVYSPIATPSPFCVSGTTTSGAGDGPGCTGNPSLLPALLDSHGHSHRTNNQRGGDARFRASAIDGSARNNVWFTAGGVMDLSQNVESTSISPRPLKKITSSSKGAPKTSPRHDSSGCQGDSPPESPQQPLRRK